MFYQQCIIKSFDIRLMNFAKASHYISDKNLFFIYVFFWLKLLIFEGTQLNLFFAYVVSLANVSFYFSDKNLTYFSNTRVWSFL